MSNISPNTTRNVHHQPRPPFILIPLYIYPSEKGKTWAPLFEAVNKYQDVSFVVIVNPDSGPGRGPRPDANYISALEALMTFDNVTILGYLPICWAERDISEISRDIRAYYHWEENNLEVISPSMRIDGIFFDEAPSKETEETVIYMGKAAGLVRRLATSHHRLWNITRQTNQERHSSVSEIVPADDFNPNANRCTVIYNPGTPPSPGSAFFDSSSQADYIVIFEQTLETWPSSINLPEEVAAPAPFSSSTLGLSSFSSSSSSSSSTSSDAHITVSSDPEQTPENHLAIEGPGRTYISCCLESLSPSERAKSIAIAHSVPSLDHQLTFAAQVVEYGLAGHFATSTADYASWTNNGGPSFQEDYDVSGHRGQALSSPGAHWMAYVDAAHQLFMTHLINAGEDLKPPVDQSVGEGSS